MTWRAFDLLEGQTTALAFTVHRYRLATRWARLVWRWTLKTLKVAGQEGFEGLSIQTTYLPHFYPG